MGDTTIAWTDKTWNPVTGCTKVSQGCKHCYAESIANRMWAQQYRPNADGSSRKFTDVRTHLDRLNQPFSWRKPARVFVNSMSDLFHEDVPNDFILRVWMVMARTPQHVYQILTKRPERMAIWVNEWLPGAWALANLTGMLTKPLPNVWLGVSVEDQANADTRIPLLLQTTAAVRFISAEPLLGAVDLLDYLPGPNTKAWCAKHGIRSVWAGPRECNCGLLDWVIVGGESGHNFRPMNTAWAESIVMQCEAAGVACFVKQMGGRRPGTELDSLPPALRVRQWPVPAREAA